MEIQVKQEKLAKALGNVSKVVSGRGTLPILNNVLIRVDDGKVSLITTNLDMAVVDFLPVIESKNGVITIPARLTQEFVSNLPRGEVVEMSVDGTKVTVKAKGYSSNINGVLADDFPELPAMDEEKLVKITVSTEAFKQGMGQVLIAASNDMTRPALTGVYFNTYEGALYLAATDGYRLAERKLPGKTEAEVAAIVPAASIRTMMGLIDEALDEIEILFDESQVKFQLGEVEVISKLVDGSFPDYRRLIPKEFEVEVELEHKELVRTTKLAALFAREVEGSIVCSTDTESQSFTVAAVANELGENSSEMKTEVNADGRIVLNSRYLIDALNVMTGEKVAVKFANNLNPILLRGNKDTDYTHIIMPLKR